MNDPDSFIEEWVRENDPITMSLPDIEYEPHLLISKVRKHYMEYVIKLLSFNYENNQKLLNKNTYLPSAIWRCAKIIETKAAQSCMVVELYRKNILKMINDLKADTKRGRLHKKLFECLTSPSLNEKKTQTKAGSFECECSCAGRKKVRKIKESFSQTSYECDKEIMNESQLFNCLNTSTPLETQSINKINELQAESVSHSAVDVMQQLEQIFQGDSAEDLFDGVLCNSNDFNYECTKKIQQDTQDKSIGFNNESVNERFASIAGTVESKSDNVIEKKTLKNKKNSGKWLCEEYFLRTKLFELLDQIQDCNRDKLLRIKQMLHELFGDDSDDEGVVSPLNETHEFVISCKERVAPWVVKLLTPYYIKGRIRGKSLFKALAKHLINLIYQGT
ncbi:unnamed protein product [Leptidea sinapis]|uniref:Set2 Rpb1 interacting domain-containing protein n=1 Tax=Leptidea sinapis TaxID=189913 RepID=A0A5E4R3D3_9NEOP|nr:unnamed protein product [Leptidea sinapis]